MQLISDGGGKAMATLNPIYGLERVLRLCEGLARKAGRNLPDRWRLCQLNGCLPFSAANRTEFFRR